MSSDTQVIDGGNTRIKVARFKNQELQALKVFDRNELPDANKFILKDLPTIISNVGDPLDFSPKISLLTNLDSDTKIPIDIQYETEDTLGADRLANSCGAYGLYPDDNCLVIDIGSCITYDVVTNKGEFLGGAISPGTDFRFRSMNNFSANLPLVQIEDTPDLIGKSTSACLQSGVYNGIIAELNGMISAYTEHFEDLKILLTGGDSVHFEKGLKYPIFADPNLTLKGLNEILLYHSR